MALNIHTVVSQHTSQILELGNKYAALLRTTEQLAQELVTLKGTMSQRVGNAEQELLRVKADVSMLNELSLDFEPTPFAVATVQPSQPSVNVPRARISEGNSRLPLIFKDGETLCPVGNGSGRREQAEAEGYMVVGTHSADGATYFKLRLRN